MERLSIPNVTAELATIWHDAERAAGELAFCWRETTVTDVMASLLRHFVNQDPRRQSLEAAFARDLAAAYPNAGFDAAAQVARGLRASVAMTVPFATIAEETRHGGDLALVVTRPVTSDQGDGLTLARWGLVVQAKMLGAEGAIGPFTRRQRELFRDQPERLLHSAVVLYPWRDSTLGALEQFRWILLAGKHACDAKRRAAEKPPEPLKTFIRRAVNEGDLLASGAIISRLCAGSIGTADPSILGQLKASLQTIEITVDWPPGGSSPPGTFARLTQGQPPSVLPPSVYLRSDRPAWYFLVFWLSSSAELAGAL